MDDATKPGLAAALAGASSPEVPITDSQADTAQKAPSSRSTQTYNNGKDGRLDPTKNMELPSTVLPEPDSSSSITIAELREFEERFCTMESKMDQVKTAYGFHQSLSEAMTQHEQYEHPRFQKLITGHIATEFDHLNFLRDSMFFMSRIRASYNMIYFREVEAREREEALKKAKRKPGPEPESIRQTTTRAFLKGEPIKVMQVDWNAYLFKETDLQEAILAPIEVVSDEPEPQTILQLGQAHKSKGESQAFHQVERIPPARGDTESSRQLLLPERIKIRSGPLAAVLGHHLYSPLSMGIVADSSFVLLRPYQDLFKYETQLKERLADLEKRFEDYDGKESDPAPPIAEKNDEENQEKREATGDSHDDGHGEDSGSNDTDDNSSRDGNAEEEKTEDDPSNSITALLHLRCLMHFVDTELKPKQEYINSDQYSHIHFQDLWHLFKPGDEIIDQGERQAYVILHVRIPVHKVEEPWERWSRLRTTDDPNNDKKDDKDGSPFVLYCSYIDFDGKSFGPVSKQFKISPFGELKSVKSLPVYPLRFAKDGRTRQDMIQRGRTLLDVAKFKPMYYMGMTLDKRDEIDSQVIIDFHEALVDEKRREAWEPTIAPVKPTPDLRDESDLCGAPCCVAHGVLDGISSDISMTQDYIEALAPDPSLRAPSLVLSPRSLEDTLNARAELTETELLVMTHRVFGFVLRSRKWAELDIALLRHENSSARNMTVSAFDRLELPEGHKEMVKSLVIQHFRHKQSVNTQDEQTDLIQGKGKGLIMLLHGAPGVGKTTTAEGIAELFRKPLFQITCGDLGTTAKEVEAELEKNFALASRWGCVLLLDEADVFLSARERMDFTRNGLVSVFLRVLEYYTGILFLTTNRVGDFDEAFASRIHMSLYYPELDEEKTLKVFKLNLNLIQERFQKQGRTLNFDTSSIEDFARQHFREHTYYRWNGRQIRNACQTALALAEFDAQGGTLDIDGTLDKNAIVQLQLKYFRTVQKAYFEFGKYLGDIQGTKGDRRAVDYKLRARTETPYQTTPSLFSQREESMRTSRQQQWQSQHLYAPRASSDFSQSNLGSQADPFAQSHVQGAPAATMVPQSQVYGQPPSYMTRQQQAYQGSIPPTGGYESPSPYRPLGVGQQAQLDARFMQSRESVPPQLDPMRAGTQSTLGGETSQNPDASYGGPMPSHQTGHYQYQQLQYGHGTMNSGAPLQGPAVPRQDVFTDVAGSMPPQGQQGQQGTGSPGNLPLR